uniref:Uncharacterized protein n=1 Tax=Peronospora matthiolae TaxID=2874970 RepID=A0AAV1TYY5_9STRA
MYLCNLIYYTSEDQVANAPTREEFVLQVSLSHEPGDEAEADDIQEMILVKETRALQFANSLQQFWMQKYAVNYEMLTASR